MDNYKSYIWREVSNDNWWRIQTTDPRIKKKLNRRKNVHLTVQCLNHSMMVYRLQYYSPQKAKQSFMRLTAQKVKKDAENELFYAEMIPILTPNNISEVV